MWNGCRVITSTLDSASMGLLSSVGLDYGLKENSVQTQLSAIFFPFQGERAVNHRWSAFFLHFVVLFWFKLDSVVMSATRLFGFELSAQNYLLLHLTLPIAVSQIQEENRMFCACYYNSKGAAGRIRIPALLASSPRACVPCTWWGC